MPKITFASRPRVDSTYRPELLGIEEIIRELDEVRRQVEQASAFTDKVALLDRAVKLAEQLAASRKAQ